MDDRTQKSNLKKEELGNNKVLPPAHFDSELIGLQIKPNFLRFLSGWVWGGGGGAVGVNIDNNHMQYEL